MKVALLVLQHLHMVLQQLKLSYQEYLMESHLVVLLWMYVTVLKQVCSFVNNVLGERHIVYDRKGQLVDPNNIESFVEYLGSGTTKDFSKGLYPFRVPEVGVVATSADLSNKEMYPYFTRVVPADDKQAGAIISLLANMGWFYIQTLQSANDYSRSGITVLKNIGKYHGVCVSASYEFGTDGSYAEILRKLRTNQKARAVVIFAGSSDMKGLFQAIKDSNIPQDFVIIGTDFWGTSNTLVEGYEDVANGAITIEPSPFGTAGFRAWLNTLNPREAMDIPWFKEWYQIVYNCYIDVENRGKYSNQCQNSPITSAPNYDEGYGLSYTINAVYAIAKALDKTLTFFCGNGYSGVCSNFRASEFTSKILLEYLHNITFSAENNKQFEMVNGEGTGQYNIYSYRQNGGYVNIGNYDTKSGSLIIQKQNIVYPSGVTPATFSSVCDTSCYECSYVNDKPLYFEQPGDIVIGGLFGVHSRSIYSQYLCGDMKTVNGFQFGSAMAYAVDRINKKLAPVSLNGIHLGTLIFDHCDVSTRAFDTLANFYSGTLKPYFWTNSPFKPESVTAWVTDSTSAVMEVKDVVKQLNLPLISPLATSEELAKLEEFPTFFRTVSGDISLSIAMAELARTLNFKHVTVVYSNNAYGMGGMETFESVTQQEGVCVTYKYNMDGSMTPAEIIKAIQTSSSHVVILWTGVADSIAMLNARRDNPVGGNIVFIFPMPFMELVGTYGGAGGNTFMLNIKRSNVDGYRQFMEQMYADGAGLNPLLVEYYMVMFKCDLPGMSIFKTPCQYENGKLVPVTRAAGYTQDNYVVPTINAVYAYVAALDATLKEKCGVGYNGICTAFSTTPNINDVVMAKMEDIGFLDPSGTQFNFLDRKGNTGLDVFFNSGGTTSVVGEFAGASLQILDSTLPDRFTSTLSSCLEPCTICIKKSLNFTYIPGDLLLGGLFDVHQNDLTPFSCGPLKTFHGFQLLEAFNYAINKVNDKSGPFANILKHVKLGGVGLDSCQSSIRTGYLVSNIHSGLTELSRNGFTLNPDDINAYIAGYSSDSSIYLARILKTLKIPQVSYASTSTELLDQDRYPYFIRSVPADDKQSMAMIEFFKKYNIKYVQVVHTSTNYGERGAKIFTEKAKENKICVAQVVPFPDNGTVTQESANDVISALLTRPMANTVIVFADQDYINEMFRAISRNPVAIGKFKFVGSDSWSNNMEAISGVEYLAEGSITLNLESSDLSDFDLYLGKKTPGNYPENPWFPEFYERMVDCYLTVPTRTRTTQCPSIPENIVAQRNYVQDPGILHVINAVYAAAIGIDLALKSECGANYTTVCEKYKNSQGRTDLLMNSILRARFTDSASKQFEFSTRREGNKGYQLYSITKKMTMGDVGYAYDKVGLYTFNGQLQTVTNYKPSWDGSCERDRACSECPSLRNLLTRYMLQPSKGQDAATLIYQGPIHSISSEADFSTKCGNFYMSGFLEALAFQYTLEKHFPNTKYNVRGLILDTCENPVRIDHDLYSLMSSGRLCNTAFTSDSDISSSTIAGVMQTTSTAVMAANRVLKPLKIPIVSNTATSTLLLDQVRFPYFARTAPPDSTLTEVLGDILKQFDWKYVSAIYSQEAYGLSLNKALKMSAEKRDVCVGLSLPVSYPATVADAKLVLQELVKQKGANVILVLSLQPRVILQAAKEMGILNKYIWVGTDTWADYSHVIRGFEEDVLGAITVGLRTARVEEVKDYIKTITYNDRKNIPEDWFLDFYQEIHKCRLSDAPNVHTDYNTECNKQERITNEKIPPGGVDLVTVAATYAMAQAVEVISRRRCSLKETFPECVRESGNYDFLFSDLLNVQWNMNGALTLSPNDSFTLKFNNQRFWDIGYYIYSVAKSQNGGQEYRTVGARTNGVTSDLSIITTVIVTMSSHQSVLLPGSCGCSVTVAGPAKQVSNLTEESKEPRNYFLYNMDRIPWQKLYTWPIWAIAVAVLTCVGLFITIFLFCYFLIAYPVKGGTTVLGFMMMIGIMGIYALNFAFFLPASEATCTGRRLMMGVVYAIVFAALLVKAIDNWRYSDYEYTVRKYKGITNSCTLLMISLGIVCVQLIIPIMWLIIVPPGAISKSDSLVHDWMWCDPWYDYDISLVLSMIFRNVPGVADSHIFCHSMGE
ncbi:hypothetical protein KUTeg_009992 [Tegillarca granosa]|uniref:G-protein coupled receptors family 3 profile domain-containing protein n=1 Tax=Tegillarca granosa TaxID=220873 RepID=A0ABQ9F5F7_TEGGR|nr:hypothetical protein KUTeg_009992 [Tegillarca granosa]